MMKIDLRNLLLGAACVAALSSTAFAQDFDVPKGNLKAALDAYRSQAGVSLVVMSDAIKGVSTPGVRGNLSPDAALSRILSGTGFVAKRDASGMIAVVPDDRRSDSAIVMPLQLAQASSPKAAVETVTVTSSKLGGADVQSIPIAITALSQEQLTSTQTAGGPDLVKQVPNLTFSKTNFTGYNIEIRGIGTQAISVTTDPAVAVAFNDIPFIRNHFFEQEFYDVSQVEVLRGPQGTLYGRNATAGVVNVIPARPTDQFEAMASGDIGNYKNRRFEGMINIPIVDDRVDIRAAGEWTKRDGYSFNELTDQPIDGRDLWSSRVSIGVKPIQELQATFIWEHFQEDDDRMRTAKQLCKTDPTPTQIGGVDIGNTGSIGSFGDVPLADQLSQGCQMSSLYTADAFEVPNGFSLPFFQGLAFAGLTNGNTDPYLSTTQSTNLRNIQTALNPTYKARNDTVELNIDYAPQPTLTLTSQTGFNRDYLYSTEDYNRFNTSPGLFIPGGGARGYQNMVSSDGVFCDPQLGCADRLVAQDLSDEHAWQLSQEFRLSSKLDGPLNFSLGGSFLHYETEENYYVFINALTLIAASPVFTSVGSSNLVWTPGVSDNSQCFIGPRGGYQYPDPTLGSTVGLCGYIDPHTIPNVNNEGHNYFLSQNPYVLNSYAGFGEVYYNVAPDLKLTGGLRWTDDQKHFVDIPSEVLAYGYGYPQSAIVNQSWKEWTGRFTANWAPQLDFTDQTLVYGSFAHGYKAGGANPPGAVLLTYQAGDIGFPSHPTTFAPEFINAYELGTKNTLLDGALTINAAAFYYDYKGYQISEIVDRTSINLNFDATVHGAEVEAHWEPVPGLKFGFAGGYEATRAANGSKAIDLIDRTAGNSSWIVMKPYITQASNCVMPVYVVQEFVSHGGQAENACGVAYAEGLDPITNLSFNADPTMCGDTNHNPSPCDLGGYPGFDPIDPNAANNGAGPAPNRGAGFDKDLSGNELPNAPHFTTSISAEYSLPVTADWAATLHGDFYWQASSWARIINDDPYDRIRGYTTVNLALIFTNQNGWQAMGYLKNVFNTTAITGTFLNSDDSGLTTNVFLTDPRLFGVRVTKNF